MIDDTIVKVHSHGQGQMGLMLAECQRTLGE